MDRAWALNDLSDHLIAVTVIQKDIEKKNHKKCTYRIIPLPFLHKIL